MLTEGERARLDPRVQVEWLERFLSRVPATQRAFVLNSFYGDPDPAEMTIVGVTEPELELLWHRAWGLEADGEAAPPE